MTASFIKFSIPTFMSTLFFKFAVLVQHAAPSCVMPLYIVLSVFISFYTLDNCSWDNTFVLGKWYTGLFCFLRLLG